MLERRENTYIFTENGTEGQNVTSQLQVAMEELSALGGGSVRFTKGKYVLSTVFLKSNVTIYLEEGAQLLGSLRFDDYCEDERLDYPLYQDASHSFFHCSMFVGIDCENIEITGKGTIDMRSVWDEKNKRDMVHRGAKCIALKNCRNVRLCGLGIYNVTDLAVYFAGCENVEVDSLKLRVYIDGISPDCSKNVTIRNCEIECGDDGIVFKSSYTLNRAAVCKNILVENCKVKSRCSAIKFGTETNGGFEDIVVSDIYIYETRLSGIAVESVDGAVLKNIRIANIRMKNVGTPIFVHLGKRLRAPKGAKIGSISDLTIENVVAEGPYEPYEVIEWNYQTFVERGRLQYPWYWLYPKSQGIEPPVQSPTGGWQTTSNVCGLEGYPLRNITLKNICLKLDGGYEGEFMERVPNEPNSYPEVYAYGRLLPAQGIFFRHIDGLTLENVRIETYRHDDRETFVFEDVTNLVTID